MATTTEAPRSKPSRLSPDRRHPSAQGKSCSKCNVSTTERIVSVASGVVLAGLGLRRQDLTGGVIAAVGSALAYRGATGHCHLYDALGLDTSTAGGDRTLEAKGVKVATSYLIDRPQEELYEYWRNFEKLPEFMSHLEHVEVIDDRRSKWVAQGPALSGGEVRWEAEITEDLPNKKIAWRTLPGSGVEHRGSIAFTRALGDRGTHVRVELEYAPPAGQVGRWIAKLFGEEPEQQIESDLRKFKRLMETGEVPTIEGQSHGSCYGLGGLLHK